MPLLIAVQDAQNPNREAADKSGNWVTDNVAQHGRPSVELRRLESFKNGG